MAAEEYEMRLTARRSSLASSDQSSARLGNIRLIVVIAALACIYWTNWWGLAAIVLIFFGIGVRIQSLTTAQQRLERAASFYERSIARLNGKWIGNGNSGDQHLPEEHLYARDLDLFGRGSLFELLCQARTRTGEQTLAHWLLNPASSETITLRQQAVQELTPNLNLREDLAVLGAGKQRQLRAAALSAWGEAPATFHKVPRTLFRIVSLFGVAAACALIADILGAELPWLRIGYLSMALVCGGILWRYREEIKHVLSNAEGAAHEVGLLSEVLARIEAEQFHSPRLSQLRAQLDVDRLPPSRLIAQLQRWMDFVDSRDHFLVRLLGPLVLWDLHLSFALEDWRAHSGKVMRVWIEAVGEMEALSSLAGYHYENPASVFPTMVDHGPHFKAAQLTHPLMPREQAVANDIRLDRELRILVVSGSNMSGKSTLMRTLGINAVLAQAGAPVFAKTLTMSPLAVGASIQTHDSLAANTSRFYAEILRLRDIMQKASSSVPVLFLIDEVLSGTNSHDRRIGAQAILRGLLDRGAIGLASTHDLALTQIADELNGLGANVHFEDQLIDGVMSFDYKMQPGVVTHSNAIGLMRAVGLEV